MNGEVDPSNFYKLLYGNRGVFTGSDQEVTARVVVFFDEALVPVGSVKHRGWDYCRRKNSHIIFEFVLNRCTFFEITKYVRDARKTDPFAIISCEIPKFAVLYYEKLNHFFSEDPPFPNTNVIIRKSEVSEKRKAEVSEKRGSEVSEKRKAEVSEKRGSEVKAADASPKKKVMVRKEPRLEVPAVPRLAHRPNVPAKGFAHLLNLNDRDFTPTGRRGEYVFAELGSSMPPLTTVLVQPGKLAYGDIQLDFDVLKLNSVAMKKLSANLVLAMETSFDAPFTLSNFFDVYHHYNLSSKIQRPFYEVFEKYMDAGCIAIHTCPICNDNFRDDCIQCDPDTGGCGAWIHSKTACSSLTSEEYVKFAAQQTLVFKCGFCLPEVQCLMQLSQASV